MGNLFGGSTKTTTSETADSGPSKFQLPYLQDAFNGAQNNYNSSKNTPFYQGDLYAGMSDQQKQALQGQIDYSTKNGLGAADQLNQIGNNLSGYFDKAGSTLDDYLKQAGQDPTQQITDAAGKYADNPYTQGMIDANSRDITRNLNESTLPGIDRQASGTGNINSSRAGVAAGIAQRGAEDRIGDISAQIRGSAYSQGLNMAQNDRNTQLGAMRDAANGYLGMAGQSVGALSAGAQAGSAAWDSINKANSALQGDKQGQLDSDYAKWQGQDSRESDLLNRYMSIVGGNQWGQSATSNGTSTSKQSGGILNSLMGGAALAGGLGWKPFGK